MLEKILGFENYIKGKRIAVLGMGISNTALIRYLSRFKVDITVFDMSEKNKLRDTISQFKNYRIDYSLGRGYLEKLEGFDIIFKTPIIRFDIPELERERERGAIITSEVELFMELCPGEIIGVTGSDGKTTTTTIIYNVLKEAGYDCWLGGNIGIPLIDKVEDIKKTDKVVLELSSFQLHTMKISPSIAIITNVSPNHLDVHKSMKEYIDAKKNIFRYQNKDNVLVLNHQNPITQEFSSESIGEVRYFSLTDRIENGAYVKKDKIIYSNKGKDKEIMGIDSIKLAGTHNLENYLGAISALAPLVDNNSILKISATFKGVEHRNEHVRDVKDISFYNDSIGSSPSRTIATINSFNKKVILIAGGYDKKLSYSELGKVISEKVKALFLIGQTGPLIEDSLKCTGKTLPAFKYLTLEEAVLAAYSYAEKGDIILLSPASASFDMFKNFEERGEKFKEIVYSL